MPERDYYNELISDTSSETFHQKNNKSDKRTHYYDVLHFDIKKRKDVLTKVKCYSSGDVGCVIRNAQYGIPYSYNISDTNANVLDKGFSSQQNKVIHHLVGSGEEEFYFKVHMPPIVSRTGEKITVIAFYNSPGQYERHMNVEVSQEVKKNWAIRRTERLLNYKHKLIFKNELEPKHTVVEHENTNVIVK